MNAPRVIAIHGVGIHPEGTIERQIKNTLSRGRVDAEVTEFNWDRVSPHFLDVDDGIADFLRQASRSAIEASRLGFSPPHRYPLPTLLRTADKVCSCVAVASFSLACTAVLILPLAAVLYLVVFSVYAELSLDDFSWALRPAGFVLIGLIAACLASSILVVTLAALAVPFRGRWVLWIFLRRYALLIVSRALIVLTAPLKLPLHGVFMMFVPFAVIYLVLSLFPFSYGILLSERLESSRLPLKIGVGLVAGWAGSAIVTWLLSKWINGPLEVTLDIARYLCDPECRSSVQEALDAKVRAAKSGQSAPLVLLAHSLGSVIALDSLVNSKEWGPDDEVIFVTMGAPIARAFVRLFPRFLFPVGVMDAARLARTRLGSLRWINVYRRLDIVGTRLGLRAEVGADVSTGQWRGHAGYWHDDRVLACILEAVPERPKVGIVGSPDAQEVWIPAREDTIHPLARRVVSAAPFVLFLITLISGFWVPVGALRIRDVALDAKVASVVAGGRTYAATVTHRENPQPGSNEDEYYYTDEFIFRYRDESGVDRTHEENVDSWVASPKSLRRFDHERLREHVRKNGNLLERTSWYARDVTIPAQVENVPITVLADSPDFVVVADFLPGDRGSYWPIFMRLFWVAVGIAVACGVLFRIFLGQPYDVG